MTAKKCALCIPTLDAGAHLDRLLPAISEQSLQPDEIIVIDSSSSDETAARLRRFGAQVEVIARSEFDHGGTRQAAVAKAPEADILMFLTQDAVPANGHAFERLAQAFEDGNVGVAYGRQLPRPGASEREVHFRCFNYPAQSYVLGAADIPGFGFRAAYLSNSFAAYRRSALIAVGGFPEETIFGEDSLVAAKIILNGWKVAYCADAQVYHSHHYTIPQEFKRTFDTGVMHARAPWLRDKFGAPEREGRRFVLSELRYLWDHDRGAVPIAVLRNCLNYIAYKLGRIERLLPLYVKLWLSMNSRFWQRDSAKGNAP